jgi:hypothetical protein
MEPYRPYQQSRARESRRVGKQIETTVRALGSVRVRPRVQYVKLSLFICFVPGPLGFEPVRTRSHFRISATNYYTSTRFMIFKLQNQEESFLTTTPTLGKPTPHYYSHPLTRPSSPLNKPHEHDATDIQEVCDKVVQQAIANLEEPGYKCVAA